MRNEALHDMSGSLRELGRGKASLTGGRLAAATETASKAQLQESGSSFTIRPEKMSHDAILIVCGGMLQVPAVEIAHGLGLTVVMTDANPRAAAMAMADVPVTLDIYDANGHCRLVDDLERRYRLLGVFAEGADVEVTVAAAAAHAGLPGI